MGCLSRLPGAAVNAEILPRPPTESQLIHRNAGDLATQ